MTASQLAETQLVDGIPAQRLLEALARVYRWVLVTDADRRVLWTSDALSEIEGFDTLDLGADARAFLGSMPHPEQVFPLRANLRHRSQLSDVPLELHTKSGENVAVEVSVLKVETDEPRASLLLAIARPRDVEALGRDAASGLDGAIIDAASEAIVAVDADGFVIRANHAAANLLGCVSQDLAGRPAAVAFGAAAPDIERVARALAGGHRLAECEVSLTRRDGRTLRAHLAASPLPLAGATGQVLVMHDVSERCEREDELRRANGELEHCVNALAHDLRSPLVALLGFSRLLRQDYGQNLDDTGTHFLDRIEQAGRTMEGLIHDLLELSRIGQPGERPSMVDPRAVLLQLHAELKPRLEEAGITLLLPDPPPPLVFCDRTRLYQLFSNLIGNAVDHMGETSDPCIEVRVTETQEGHQIEVRDNGRGIPPEHHERIFEVFQSLSWRRDGRRGTGIGLAIVKKIAESRGGRAWVESAPGAGSRFIVSLPGH
jgi:PAS domain S-box-containing protein